MASDEDATSLYTGVITRLGFTPAHIYDIALDQDSYYNPIKIKAANGGTGNVTLTREYRPPTEFRPTAAGIASPAAA
ncbi:MAG: hypothetical protein K6G08_10690 [Prevotella sp.]|nr:hypothetical protein [Prevotella sp.]